MIIIITYSIYYRDKKLSCQDYLSIPIRWYLLLKSGPKNMDHVVSISDDTTCETFVPKKKKSYPEIIPRR